MGLSLFSSSVFDRPETIYVDRPVQVLTGNPNPWRFKILRIEKVRRNLVVEVIYPDATNYEGRKIIVYLNTRPKVIESLKVLDPHFTNGRGPKPFARFEPTDYGWEAAISLARKLR